MSYPTSKFYRLAQWLRGKALACEFKNIRFESIGCEKHFLDIGMDSDVDIGTLPISE
jgi:hypothetical protein